MTLQLVAEARSQGASLKEACAVLGIDPRTVQRWQQQGHDAEDQRQGPRTVAAHALSPAERHKIVEIATAPRFRNLSVRQIVPLLADEGTYVASESSFYRVLRDEDLSAYRGHPRPARRAHTKPVLTASRPNQVWCWDITYLRSPIRGQFFYLYLHVDLFSRKIVAWEVHADESMDLAAKLAEKAIRDQRIDAKSLVLHSDNGGPMKGSSMLATLQRLGIAPSFSRPRVSDDNAFCEALFRTLKYRPGFPRKPFPSLDAARAWVRDFVAWYNDEHLHSGIRYVTPSARHDGRDADILAARDALYAAAKRRTPRRWTGDTRDWTPIGPVHINPENGTHHHAA